MTEARCEGPQAWAKRQFGQVELGDVRRNARLLHIAASACERPRGNLAAVFDNDKDEQAAYDFVESKDVEVEDLVSGIASATAQQCKGEPYVVVPTDGTSIAVVDRERQTDVGRVGADNKGGRGMKVIDALAVTPDGVPVGLLGLTWWARSEAKAPAKTHARQTRGLHEKETRFWVQTVQRAGNVLDEHQVRGWFQIDREGDSRELLMALAQTRHWWTVRGNADRSIELEDGDKDKLRAELSRQPEAGTYELDVVARPGKRRARTARMTVRFTRVTLRMRDKKTDRITRFPVTAVWAHEQGTTPDGEDPIDWMLYTNHPVASLEDAMRVIAAYALRWRVEEFHRTWKRGDIDIESTQLKSASSVSIWATILAAAAVRIERLKRLARVHGTRPATIDLSRFEIQALQLLRFGATPPAEVPTIAQAVAWISEMGGWAGKYSGKPPGATVIARGLRHLRSAAELLEIQQGQRCEK
jgi:hypothetical protein